VADDDKPPEPTPAAPGTGAGTRFWLEYRSNLFELAPGTTAIGRSAGCQLVLDDPLVSRRHVEIVIAGNSATLVDLGSINGAFVNGDAVKGRRMLSPGDRIVIGKQEMILRAQGMVAIAADDTRRFAAETLSGLEAVPPPDKNRATLLDPFSEESEAEATQQGQALDLLGGVAEKVLALGRGDEAEKILAAYLNNLLESARRSGFDPVASEKAASYAVKLAAATRKGQWVSYCFELYRAIRRPLPGPVVDQLYDVLRNVNDLSLVPLRSYVATLRSMANQLGPADRFLLHRIEGLERVASAK
jgi:pSer/pThr/pTyr-binding forkhead associated (FHA) protein